MFHTGFKIRALFLSDDNDGNILKAADTANHSLIVAKQAVAAERGKIFNQGMNIIQAVRALGMAGNLKFLPRGQVSVCQLDLFFEFLFQTVNLLGDIDILVFGQEF